MQFTKHPLQCNTFFKVFWFNRQPGNVSVFREEHKSSCIAGPAGFSLSHPELLNAYDRCQDPNRRGNRQASREQKQILKLLEDIKDISSRTVYQRWDTQSLKIVQTLGPDKYDEFVNYFSTDHN